MPTIEEAIKLNKESIESLEKGNFKKYAKAVALGNEALKRTHQARIRKEPYWGALLPGETERKQHG